MLRIAEICFSRAGGGLELYMAQISRLLQERGHSVVAVAPPASFLDERLAEAGVKRFPLNSRLAYMDLPAAVLLSRLLRRMKADVLHCHQSRDLSTALLAAKLAGRGRVVFTCQMETSRVKKDLFHRWVYGNLGGVITITQRMHRLMLQNTVLTGDRVVCLYYGIPVTPEANLPDARLQARRRWGFADEEKVVGLIGRLEEGKGQHILLQAAAQLHRRFPEMRLMFIGGETHGQSGYLAHLKKMAEEMGLSDHTVFTGFQKDVPAVSAALDICVLASRKETFGISLIEAMAASAAPVGTNAGGVPEIIVHEKNGLLVPPFDVPALAGALERLLADNDLRNELARQARKTVVEKFNLEGHLDRLERLLRRLAAQGTEEKKN